MKFIKYLNYKLLNLINRYNNNNFFKKVKISLLITVESNNFLCNEKPNNTCFKKT
jgi:hypothetical protein